MYDRLFFIYAYIYHAILGSYGLVLIITDLGFKLDLLHITNKKPMQTLEIWFVKNHHTLTFTTVHDLDTPGYRGLTRCGMSLIQHNKVDLESACFLT